MIDLKGFEKYLREEELAENTICAYVYAVKKYSELYKRISKQNLIDFKQKMIEKFSPKTVNLRITAMLRYCDYKNIHMKIKSIKEPKKTYIENVISVQQYEHLMSCLKIENLRWYYNILLISRTGMRISEALKIRKKDVISGRVDLYTKSHMRTVYFPKSLRDELSEYLENFKDDDLIAVNFYGKPLTSRGYSGMLTKFSKKYDIPKEVMHPHAFRHFFAIEFLKRNNNISLLADLLGHNDLKVTQIYLRQSQEQQRNAVDEAVNW